MVSATTVFIRGHSSMGQNPELKSLFHRLSRLSTLPIAAIFVFDGPERPKYKRGTYVPPLNHFMTEPFQAFIKAFGFEFRMVRELSIHESH